MNYAIFYLNENNQLEEYPAWPMDLEEAIDYVNEEGNRDTTYYFIPCVTTGKYWRDE